MSDEYDEFQAWVIRWTADGFSIYISADEAREFELEGWETGSVCNNMQSANTRNVRHVRDALKRGVQITPKAALQL